MTDPVPWDEQGCPVCREGWVQGRSPRKLIVNAARHATLYRCDVCQTYWMETERYAVAIYTDEVREEFGDGEW